MSLPFSETKSGDQFVREFSQSTDSGEFTWHRDREDRIVVSLHRTDWMVQLDNQLPVPLNQEVLIPKGTWHRVIKGTGDLRIKMVKLV